MKSSLKKLKQMKEYRESHKEDILKKAKEYYIKNKVRILEEKRKYRQRADVKVQRREYRIKTLGRTKEYRERSKDKLRENAQAYYVENKSRMLKYSKKYSEGFVGRYSSWKGKARRRNLAWGVTKEYLRTLPATCRYTGEELTFERNKPNTISLDRIDSSKGYIEGNVCFCSTPINLMKSTHTEEEFFEFCRRVASHQETKNRTKNG